MDNECMAPVCKPFAQKGCQVTRTLQGANPFFGKAQRWPMNKFARKIGKEIPLEEAMFVIGCIKYINL